MLKEAAAVTGGALLLPSIGVSMVACGVPGLLIAGAGLFLADTLMKEKRASATPGGDPANEREEDWQTVSSVEPDSTR